MVDVLLCVVDMIVGSSYLRICLDLVTMAAQVAYKLESHTNMLSLV